MYVWMRYVLSLSLTCLGYNSDNMVSATDDDGHLFARQVYFSVINCFIDAVNAINWLQQAALLQCMCITVLQYMSAIFQWLNFGQCYFCCALIHGIDMFV